MECLLIYHFNRNKWNFMFQLGSDRLRKKYYYKHQNKIFNNQNIKHIILYCLSRWINKKINLNLYFFFTLFIFKNHFSVWSIKVIIILFSLIFIHRKNQSTLLMRSHLFKYGVFHCLPKYFHIYKKKVLYHSCFPKSNYI